MPSFRHRVKGVVKHAAEGSLRCDLMDNDPAWERIDRVDVAAFLGVKVGDPLPPLQPITTPPAGAPAPFLPPTTEEVTDDGRIGAAQDRREA